MATQQQRAPSGAPEHLTQTLKASVTESPTKQEVAVDAALIFAGIAEIISPPVAIGGLALNRLVHHAK